MRIVYLEKIYKPKIKSCDISSLWFLLPCSRSFTEKLHQSALNIQPKHSREIKQKGHEYKVEWDPLVVSVVHHRVGPTLLISS